MNHGKAITESQLESLYNDADVMEEIRAQFGEELLPGITSEDAFARETLGSRSPRVQQTADQEAIILAFGRPSILIRDQTFDVPDSTTWQKRLKNVRHNLEAVIPSISNGLAQRGSSTSECS